MSDNKQLETLTWESFLQECQPGRWIVPDLEPRELPAVWHTDVPSVVNLFCSHSMCGRMMRHSTTAAKFESWKDSEGFRLIVYTCVHCQQSLHVFALAHKPIASGIAVLKFGQFPPLGSDLTPAMRRLATSEGQELLVKARQCVRLGFGVGAFNYMRLAVEDMRLRLFTELAKTAGTPSQQSLFTSALKEDSFSASFDLVKDSLPPFLDLPNGNPLALLYASLSEGMHHGADDSECLAHAMHAHDLILTLLTLMQERKEASRRQSEALKALSAFRDSSKQKKQDLAHETDPQNSGPDNPLDT